MGIKGDPIICGIYKITNPKGRIYIGQSINCLWRKYLHSRMSCKSRGKLYNSVKKYGWRKHKFEIIHVCEPTELNELEVYYINLYQTFNSFYGMNLREGGHQNYKMSEESKKKVGDGNRGKIRTPEAKLRMSISGRNSGIKKRRPVYQFNKEGVLVCSYFCTREAVEKTGFKRGGIKDCCRGRQPSAYGFYWSYDPNFTPPKIEVSNCKECKKEFVKNVKNKVFCSHDCWYRNFYPEYIKN